MSDKQTEDQKLVQRLNGFPVTGSGNGSSMHYLVEARTTYTEPCEIAGNVISNNWKRVNFARTIPPFGVPSGPDWDDGAHKHGLMSYPAAEAMRWWLLAHAEASRPTGSLCIETRLVKVEYAFTYKITELGVLAPASVIERVRGVVPVPRVTP